MALEIPDPDNEIIGSVSITDVAKACGLSVMTVSRALRNTYGVNPKTRQKVLQTADKMGYLRNRIATNLVQQKSNMVGVVIPETDQSIFPAVLRGLEKSISPHHLGILLSCSYDNPERELNMVQRFLEHRVDGIVLVPSSIDASREIIRQVTRHRRPIVLVDRIVPDVELDAVTVDDREGAFIATRHLLDQGYQRIVHIAGPTSIWTALERIEGFKEAMTLAGRGDDIENSIIHGAFTVEDGAMAMEAILKRRNRPDAVFCANDPIALGAYKVLLRQGIRIPSEMGLVGFSDSLEAEIMGVPLTTVAQHPEKLGMEAGRLLMRRIQAPEKQDASAPPEFERCIVPTSLIVRQSSMRQNPHLPSQI